VWSAPKAVILHTGSKLFWRIRRTIHYRVITANYKVGCVCVCAVLNSAAITHKCPPSSRRDT
jgi:hypothetical protein